MLWLLLYIGVIFCLVVKCAVVVHVYWCDLLFVVKCVVVVVVYIRVIVCLVVKCAVVVYVYWCDLLFVVKCAVVVVYWFDLLFSSKMCCGCSCILV